MSQLYLQDFAGDETGVTPGGGTFWESPAIIVTPPGSTTETYRLAAFETFNARLTVRNGGPAPVANALVQLFVSPASGAFTDSSVTLLGTVTMDPTDPIPEATPAGAGVKVYNLPFQLPANPAGGAAEEHRCLLARASVPEEDTFAPQGYAAAADRLVAQRNITLLKGVMRRAQGFTFGVTPPNGRDQQGRLDVQLIDQAPVLNRVAASLQVEHKRAFHAVPLQRLPVADFKVALSDRSVQTPRLANPVLQPGAPTTAHPFDVAAHLRPLELGRAHLDLGALHDLAFDRSVVAPLRAGELRQGVVRLPPVTLAEGELYGVRVRQLDEGGRVVGGVTIIVAETP